MTDNEYTKEFSGFSSSLIDEVLFNENDDTVILDVNDWMYRYSGVKHVDVADLVSADSVGGYYNTYFKEKFGPGEKLGFYSEVEVILVPVKKDQSVPTTPKNLVEASGMRVVNINNYGKAVPTAAGDYAHLSVVPDREGPAEATTREYSLNVFDQSVSGAPVATSDEPTKEYSLNLPGLSVVADDDVLDLTFVVHFTLKGVDGKYKFVAEYAETVEDAIEELHTYVSRMGASGKVKKVVVKFND